MSFLPCEESCDRKPFYRSHGKNARKNLGNELLEEDVPKIGHVQVFLRIKPVDHDDHLDLSSTLQIKDEHTLVTYAPKESYTFKSLKHSADSTNGYKFSRIFGPSTSQKDIFDGVVAPFVQDFVNGTDCLLFAYGPSSAGKTFTMQGSPKHPGLIPRTLDVLFNSVKDYIMKEIKYKPMKHDNITILSDEAVELELKRKEFILNWNPKSVQESSRYIKSILPDYTTLGSDTSDKETSGLEYISSCSDISMRFLSESRLKDKDAVMLQEKQKDMKYSIWVSFAEVYNETVYDLLEYLPGKAPANIKRNKLKLINDQNGKTFISDLREVCVMSEDEAYQVMLFGKCNLQFASTKLNHKSSRSHCIFTIKLVQIPNISDPKYARINMFTFCDLAGSERVEKSGNIGERLKETGNINTSLLVLGRCLKALRNNQTFDGKTVVPFRESKLTRMFQNSLTGSGNVAMIVNVNQSPLLFDETINVLKYSAVAQEIVLKPPEIIKPFSKRKTRFSVFVEKLKNSDTTAFLESSDEGYPLEGLKSNEKDYYEQEVTRLKNEVEVLKEEINNRELIVRRELCNRFTEMMHEEQRKTRKLLRETEKDTEEYYLWEIERMEQKFEERLKKARMDGNGCDLSKEQGSLIDSLNTKMEMMTHEVEELKNKLNKVQSENDELKAINNDFKCKIEAMEFDSLDKHEPFRKEEVKIGKEDSNHLITKMNHQIQLMNAELREKNSKIKDFEKLLEEASADYLELENRATEYQEKIFQQKSAMAEMEIKIFELISNEEVCDTLLAECNANLERKNDLIEKLENEIKEYKKKTEASHLLEDGIAAVDRVEKLKLVINDLNEENASLKESVSQMQLKVLYYQNEIENYSDAIPIQGKCKSLLNSADNKFKIEYSTQENLNVKEKKQLDEEVSSHNIKAHETMDSIANARSEVEIQMLNVGIRKICIDQSMEKKFEKGLQCDNISSTYEKEINDLKLLLEEKKINLLKEEESKKILEEEKNAEIVQLQKALKAFLQEKCQVLEAVKSLESEKEELEKKIKCLEVEVKESNKALREVIKEKRQEDDQNKSKVFEGSEKLLEVLKEELEKKGETIHRLLEDNQRIRDVIIEKERELQAFSDNHEKQFKHYESLVSKLREDIEMHNREEMRLRSLLQIGTPNKYEKSYVSVSNELLQLRKQLSTDLCKECYIKVLPTEKKNSDIRITVCNENIAPNSRTRRRSKSQPSYSFVDYHEYDDDSDFELEKKPRSRMRRTRADKTFNGLEQNMKEMERSGEPGEHKTPIIKSRKLLNPKDGGTFLDLKEEMPIMPRTPADVIKRMLRPRKN